MKERTLEEIVDGAIGLAVEIGVLAVLFTVIERLFPFYDLLFRTWYMPDSIPTEFGAGETRAPAGFWRQLAYPFRQPKKGDALAKDVERVGRI